MYFNIDCWMDENEAKQYMSSVLSPNPSPAIKRFHPSDSSSDSPCAKQLIVEMDTTNPDTSLQATLNNFISQYNADMKKQHENITSMQTQLNNLSEKMVTESSLKSVKDDLLLEIAGVSSSVTELKANFNELKLEYDKRITELEKALLEVKLPTKKPFDVDTTIVMTGLKPSPAEDLKSICNTVIKDGVGISNIECIDAARFGAYNGKPGIVKMEFNSLADKLAILREKKNLKNFSRYGKIFIRSSQSHEQRLLQQHTTEILKFLGKENDYYFNGSGRLIRKTETPTMGGRSQLDDIKNFAEEPHPSGRQLAIGFIPVRFI